MPTLRGLLIALATTGMVTLTCDPAAAINLEGTWKGKLSCTTQEQGEAAGASNEEVTFGITQFGPNLRLVLGSVRFEGVVVNDGSDLTKGLMVFRSCDGSAFVLDGGGRVTIKADDLDGGKISGQATGADRGSVRICSLQLKRTSASDPNVGVCPEPL